MLIVHFRAEQSELSLRVNHNLHTILFHGHIELFRLLTIVQRVGKAVAAACSHADAEGVAGRSIREEVFDAFDGSLGEDEGGADGERASASGRTNRRRDSRSLKEGGGGLSGISVDEQELLKMPRVKNKG